MSAVTTSLSRIREQSARIRAALLTRDIAQPVERSAWCVAEHLDHTIKVTSSTMRVLLKPELPRLPNGINMIGRLVLLTGWIPRGRGKAPEKLRGAVCSAEDLKARLVELDELIDRIAAEPPRNGDPVVRHPFFGGLSFRQALRFLAIHTDHHLKIVGVM
jgi:hypothetical protein